MGRGREAYRKAQRLLQQWRHFDLGWAATNAPPVREGAPVVVNARTLFAWTLNPLRISFVEERALRPDQLPPWAGAQPAASSGSSSGGGGSSGGGDSGGGGWLGLGRRAGGRATQQQQQQQQQGSQRRQGARAPRGRRFAFAHTTLAGHQISGEERFAVAWNQEDDSGGC